MEAPPTTVADSLVAALACLGVRYVFGVSGANIEHLHDAIHRQDEVQSVLARREDAAAYMADCHARVHRRLGVCCSTSGGGMMNLVAGIAESYGESVPVLAIVGQPPTVLQGRGAFQDSSGVGRAIDGLSMWQAVAKFVATIGSARDLWPALTKAVGQALGGRQGPAVLLVPRDVFAEPGPAMPDGWLPALQQAVAPRAPAADALESLVTVLAGARRPMVLLGQGVRRSADPAAVVDLVRSLGIPVATTMSARGDFPNDDPLHLGTVGAAGHPSVHRHVEREVDLIVAMGTSLDNMTRGPLVEALAHTRVAIVNIDPGDLIRLPLDLAVVVEADVGLTARMLLDGVDTGRLGPWPPVGNRTERFRPRLAPRLADDDRPAPARPGGLLQSEALAVLERHLPVGGHIVLDAGNCAAAALHLTDVPAGTSSTIALGMGAMGYSIAGAIGATLGSPDGARTVVCAGDGAFLMLGFEIHAAVDLRLPILFVIFNNNMHGMCVTRQQLYFDGRIEAVRYPPVDVAQVARGLGSPERLWVSSPTSIDELSRALDDYARDTERPGVLEIRLGAEEMPPFTPFLTPDEPTFSR